MTNSQSREHSVMSDETLCGKWEKGSRPRHPLQRKRGIDIVRALLCKHTQATPPREVFLHI